jgi:hypothetical protein
MGLIIKLYAAIFVILKRKIWSLRWNCRIFTNHLDRANLIRQIGEYSKLTTHALIAGVGYIYYIWQTIFLVNSTKLFGTPPPVEETTPPKFQHKIIILAIAPTFWCRLVPFFFFFKVPAYFAFYLRKISYWPQEGVWGTPGCLRKALFKQTK